MRPLRTDDVQAIGHQRKYEYPPGITVEGYIYVLLVHVTEDFVVDGVEV